MVRIHSNFIWTDLKAQSIFLDFEKWNCMHIFFWNMKLYAYIYTHQLDWPSIKLVQLSILIEISYQFFSNNSTFWQPIGFNKLYQIWNAVICRFLNLFYFEWKCNFHRLMSIKIKNTKHITHRMHISFRNHFIAYFIYINIYSNNHYYQISLLLI